MRRRIRQSEQAKSAAASSVGGRQIQGFDGGLEGGGRLLDEATGTRFLIERRLMISVPVVVVESSTTSSVSSASSVSSVSSAWAAWHSWAFSRSRRVSSTSRFARAVSSHAEPRGDW